MFPGLFVQLVNVGCWMCNTIKAISSIKANDHSEIGAMVSQVICVSRLNSCGSGNVCFLMFLQKYFVPLVISVA